jgi:hypothetical protein
LITNFSTSSVRTGVKRKRFWDQNAVANSFFSIATTTLTTTTASIEFTSIPQTYTHLQIRGITRTDRSAAAQDAFKMRFNSDTTETNYYNHYISGDGSSASSFANNNSLIGITSSTNATSQIQGIIVIDILDYANTNKYKTSRTLTGTDQNGSGQLWLASHLWKSTNAITSISFVPNLGTNFVQYSSFALYGVKA